jgi:hypothetical protein
MGKKLRAGLVELPPDVPVGVGEVRGVRFVTDGEGVRFVRITDASRNHVEAVRKRAKKQCPDKLRSFHVPTSGGVQIAMCVANEALVDVLRGFLPSAEAETLKAAIAEAPVVDPWPTPEPEVAPPPPSSPPSDEGGAASAALEVLAVPFGPTSILTVLDGVDEWVLVKPVSEAVGLDGEGQRQYLERQSWASNPSNPWTSILQAQLPGDVQRRSHFCIHRKRFAMWMATLNQTMVSPEFLPVLEKFQNEAADVLDAYFTKGAAVNPRANPDDVRAEVERQLSAVLGEFARKSDIETLATKTDVATLRERFDFVKRGVERVEAIHACPGHAKVIGKKGGDEIRAALLQIADLRTPEGLPPAARRTVLASLRSDAETNLRREIEYVAAKGNSWDMLDAGLWLPTNRAINGMLAGARKAAIAMGKTNQQSLFPPPPGDDPSPPKPDHEKPN